MAYNLLVVYQLPQSAIHYEQVQNAVKSLGHWARVQPTVWYVRSGLAAKDARDHIWRHMRLGDTLLVVELNSAAWQGLAKEIADFLKTRWHQD